MIKSIFSVYFRLWMDYWFLLCGRYANVLHPIIPVILSHYFEEHHLWPNKDIYSATHILIITMFLYRQKYFPTPDSCFLTNAPFCRPPQLDQEWRGQQGVGWGRGKGQRGRSWRRSWRMTQRCETGRWLAGRVQAWRRIRLIIINKLWEKY